MKSNSEIKVGAKVECHGFAGTVVRICEWSTALIEVRLPGGVVCVDVEECKVIA